MAGSSRAAWWPASLHCHPEHKPWLAFASPPARPQLSSHQGSLSALRRQLAAAHAEQAQLSGQLRTGLATAGEAAAADAQLSTEVGHACIVSCSFCSSRDWLLSNGSAANERCFS